MFSVPPFLQGSGRTTSARIFRDWVSTDTHQIHTTLKLVIDLNFIHFMFTFRNVYDILNSVQYSSFYFSRIIFVLTNFSLCSQPTAKIASDCCAAVISDGVFACGRCLSRQQKSKSSARCIFESA